MKYLLTLLLLISSLSFGDWGDTYFCSMNTLMEVKPDNEKMTYQLQTFKFRLDKQKNAVVFPETEKQQYFSSYEVPIGYENMADDRWIAHGLFFGTITFVEGTFFHSGSGPDDDGNLTLLNIIADCEKFD